MRPEPLREAPRGARSYQDRSSVMAGVPGFAGITSCCVKQGSFYNESCCFLGAYSSTSHRAALRVLDEKRDELY